MAIPESFRRALARRFAGIAGRLMVTKVTPATSSSPLRVSGTTFKGDTAEDLAAFQQWGFASVPKIGSESIYLQIGGSESHLVLIGEADPRSIPGLVEGEVALWTDEDILIHLKRGPELVISAAGPIGITASGSGDVTVEASGSGGVAVIAGGAVTVDGTDITVTATGTLTLDGATVAIEGTLTINGAAYLSHTHLAGAYLDSTPAPVTGTSGIVV
ncbi:MAG: phage baseplate assembly protein [Vicinamibacteria bacterium]